MMWSIVGLGVVAVAIAAFLGTLAVRRTLPTWIFDTLVLVGAAGAGAARLARSQEPLWPAAAALGVALVYFLSTRVELSLPRTGGLKVAPGDRLPDVTLLDTAGRPVRTGELGARGPAMLVLYRGWWCPYCVTQLGALEREHDALRAAGLAIFAISVDRPDEQQPLETRLAGRVTFLSDEKGALLDALGVRHRDGVPWYDRLLFGARRQDISLPATLVVDQSGIVRFARRARRIDERVATTEVLTAWRSEAAGVAPTSATAAKDPAARRPA